jgi:hypothetical protein
MIMEKRILRRNLNLRGKREQGAAEKYIMRRFVIFNF